MERTCHDAASMPITIRLRSGDAPGEDPELTFDAPRIVIGRSKGCEIQLPDPSVSQRHASLRLRGVEYVVVDEGSTNGTFFADTRLAPHSPQVLRTGDLIRVGRIWLEIRYLPVAVQIATQNSTKELALALVANALAAQGEEACPKLRVVEGTDQGAELALPLFEQPYVLGRGDQVALALNDSDTSRRHLEVIRRGNGIYLRELNSKNGSFLGETPLAPNQQLRWPKNQTLRIGSNYFEYTDPVSEALDELSQSADEQLAPHELIDAPNQQNSQEPGARKAGAPSSEALPEGVVDQALLDDVAQGHAEAREPGKSIPQGKTPRAKQPAPRPIKPGWGKTDLLVALAALCVLAISLVGILWLFKSG